MIRRQAIKSIIGALVVPLIVPPTIAEWEVDLDSPAQYFITKDRKVKLTGNWQVEDYEWIELKC